MKSFLLNAVERTYGCFTAEFFQMQHASFSGRCGGRPAFGNGKGTRKKTPSCAHERQNNLPATSLRLPFQANAHVMDQDFKIFESVILLIEKEKRRLRNTVTKTAKKNCG
jgi:hypothetical protein